MGPEAEASPFGDYGSVYNESLGLVGDSLFRLHAEISVEGSIQ